MQNIDQKTTYVLLQLQTKETNLQLLFVIIQLYNIWLHLHQLHIIQKKKDKDDIDGTTMRKGRSAFITSCKCNTLLLWTEKDTNLVIKKIFGIRGCLPFISDLIFSSIWCFEASRIITTGIYPLSFPCPSVTAT